MIDKNEISTLKAVLLYIINGWNGTQKCDVYHIVKAALYAQEFHLVRYMRPLCKGSIIALPYGPAPTAIYDALKIARGDARAIACHENDGLVDMAAPIVFSDEIFSTKEKPDKGCLSRSQVECLDAAMRKVGDMSFDELMSHTYQSEWKRASRTQSRCMDLLAIARKGGADNSAIAYMKQSLELDKALAQVMEIGESHPLKELAVNPGSVFRMRFCPQDVVPKDNGDTSQDKYFVILGRDVAGGYVALSLVNTEINKNLKKRIGAFQYQISSYDYDFLNDFVDCYDIKEVASERILNQCDYAGLISKSDMNAIIKLVNGSPIVSVAKLRWCGIFVEGKDFFTTAPKGNKSFDEAIKGIKSSDALEALCNAIKKPEALQKYQKERLAKKLIKYANTYDELSRVKDYVETNMNYSLTQKQLLILIEKLVWTSSNTTQLLTVQGYAKSKHLLSRYMKFFFNREIAAAMNENPLF